MYFVIYVPLTASLGSLGSTQFPYRSDVSLETFVVYQLLIQLSKLLAHSNDSIKYRVSLVTHGFHFVRSLHDLEVHCIVQCLVFSLMDGYFGRNGLYFLDEVYLG